jgi:hypothetical protein
MTDTREMTRSEMRRRRTLERTDACERATAVCERVALVLSKARRILVDRRFAEILHSQGVQSLPLSLTADDGAPRRDGGKPAPAKDRLDKVSLEFAIAWTFLFPMFAKPVIANHLEEAWPGFILEMKDVFITLVVEGPFPHVMSGHRGRRHGAYYHPDHGHRLQRP